MPSPEPMFASADDMPVTIQDVIAEYKLDFPHRDAEERYKWEAVFHYQAKWNLDAPDFAEMIADAFHETCNLLTSYMYYPYQALCELAKAKPELARSLFRQLYDESRPFGERYQNFRTTFAKEYQTLPQTNDPGRTKPLNHYQDLHAVSIYLFFQYPEKYYMYKYNMYQHFQNLIGFTAKKPKHSPESPKSHDSNAEAWKMEQYRLLCEQVLEEIEKDEELLSMSAARLPQENCYQDTTHHLLVVDLIYFGSKLAEDSKDLIGTPSVYWPGPEEYQSGLSKESWKSILQNESLTSAEHLALFKMLFKLGGESTCAHLAEIYGKDPNYYNRLSSSYAEKIKKEMSCPDIFQDGVLRYFPVLFVGRYVIEKGKRRYSWKLREELRQALEELDLSQIIINNETIQKGSPIMNPTSISPVYPASDRGAKTDVPKNLILYGPPGTGKTYSTVLYAVAAIENRTLESVKKEAYTAVLARFQVYKANNLIELTTFHQSYGYEEFIEGIRPVMEDGREEDGNSSDTDIQYEITSGLFQSFCERAALPDQKEDTRFALNHDPVIWKVSLEGTGNNPTREECMREGHIRIGWDGYGEHISSATKFIDGGKKVLNAFISRMKQGDLVLSCYSNTTIDAIGVITGDVEWHKEYSSYRRLRKVNWLVKNIREDITELNGGRTMTLSTVYKLSVSLSDVMDIIKKYQTPSQNISGSPLKRNHVFIIDEINRGNISKIFGELITLIEPSKRVGQPEEMKIRLPYSKKWFGVPDNIFLIGTMNTADRSITTLDTALRRRFQFQEMQPDASVLAGINVEGISISDMLIRMNKRICILYDREHTIGHSYFMPLKEACRQTTNSPDPDPIAAVSSAKPKTPFELLGEIFANNILPLLQEYFYEDYEKIRLVLGDNQKENRTDQFIVEVREDSGALFGTTAYDFDETNLYEINPEAFGRIDAYRYI
jgi:hypothetical protein|nr:AAA family ATPase [uncultured Schaedlerella sp.]